MNQSKNIIRSNYMKIGDPETASTGTKLMKGVFVREYNIVNVEDYSNVPNKPTKTIGQKGFEPEICIKLYLQNSGMDKPYEKILFGKYKKDKVTGEIKNWDSFNNSVQWLLYKMFGEFEINSDFSIPQTLLFRLNSQKVEVISYVADYDVNEKKLKYETYSKFFPAKATIEEMQVQFEKDLPYLKKYNPKAVDLMEEDSTNFNVEEMNKINNTPSF